MSLCKAAAPHRSLHTGVISVTPGIYENGISYEAFMALLEEVQLLQDGHSVSQILALPRSTEIGPTVSSGTRSCGDHVSTAEESLAITMTQLCGDENFLARNMDGVCPCNRFKSAY